MNEHLLPKSAGYDGIAILIAFEAILIGIFGFTIWLMGQFLPRWPGLL